ncbi:methylated-DNA--[protein]-cysteine S-methyltransferase [Adhaeribacter swui]|uniref:methylated-DNA--[protein]-cysteine S-methyltransferase n=1 Tax=Adhaeribacter swui TaxID=2086471 RepID=A0A7G7G9C8_9BACT|nr:bifunctional helix-turn-helix domain-containing protein/methylated-DNA--[protein]-cysteine S-methyltransferase [Adhaeribacter swui]QNF33762.1 methylated-DNA--[protein]-cysteine S-methyltransferase [Adhaeribacter swui]
MNAQDLLHYNRIAEAIDYIQTNFKSQPNLEEVAEKVHLSPFHFQRVFNEWAGTSPKKFLQYTTVNYAKRLLTENQVTLFDAAYHTGLSSTSRLHDLFVNIEGMTPAEYKNGGKTLTINYSFAATLFGNMIIASTAKGVCYMAFHENEKLSLAALQAKFQNATFRQHQDLVQQNALLFFNHDWTQLNQVKLHLKGTPFQLKVWEALLKIPLGQLATYGSIARQVELPHASRAVGTAIGSNPVAFLIPCHRVIQASGNLGGYMWGTTRKKVIIGWEASRVNALEI